jgi:hypothetical protein
VHYGVSSLLRWLSLRLLQVSLIKSFLPFETFRKTKAALPFTRKIVEK